MLNRNAAIVAIRAFQVIPTIILIPLWVQRRKTKLEIFPCSYTLPKLCRRYFIKLTFCDRLDYRNEVAEGRSGATPRSYIPMAA
jgi:hypothetical protein